MLLYINKQQIKRIRKNLANKLNAIYTEQAQPITTICMLNGAFMFYSDLLKDLTFALKTAFMHASTYKDTTSTGILKIKYDVDPEIVTNKRILIIEDIIDTQC